MASISLRHAPDDAQHAVVKALGDLASAEGEASLAGGAPVDLSDPIPLYRLGLDQIETSDSIAKAEQVGWRYLVDQPHGGALYADCKQVGSEPARFASLSDGPQASSLIEAASLAEVVANESADAFDARILDVPALYISAFWLEGRTERIFIPYADARESKGAPKVEPDFLEALAAQANERRQELADSAMRRLSRPDAGRAIPIRKRRNAAKQRQHEPSTNHGD